jgi:hypothetical protein
MWLLFIPILILFVVILSVGAGVVALVGAGWPWILIAVGLWLFWHEDGRHHRARHARHEWAKASAAVVEESGDRHTKRKSSTSEASRSEARRPRQPELPIDVQVKVEQIRRKVDVLLGYADRFPPFSQDLYLVRQTASDYLPRTINAYLAMDKLTAEKPMTPDGKTAHQELKAQLDLLDAKLDDIAQDLERQDTDRLLANRRFLEQRFGMRDPAVHVDVA